MDGDPTSGLRVLTSIDWPDVVVSLSGELDLATAGYLCERLLPLVSVAADPPPRLVVDVAAVSFVDVAGLRGLLEVARYVATAGGGLVLRRTPEEFDRLVRLLGLADRLPPASGAGRQRRGSS